MAGNSTALVANNGGATTISAAGGGNAAGALAATVPAGVNPPAGVAGTGGSTAAIVKTSNPAVAASREFSINQ